MGGPTTRQLYNMLVSQSFKDEYGNTIPTSADWMAGIVYVSSPQAGGTGNTIIRLFGNKGDHG